MRIIHTSGHAYLKGLKRLVSALKPKAIIPIHTLSVTHMVIISRMWLGLRIKRLLEDLEKEKELIFGSLRKFDGTASID